MARKRRTPEEIEKSKERARIILEDRQKKKEQKSVKNSRITLIVVGCLYVLIGAYEAFYAPGADILFGIIDWGIACIFFGLAYWSTKEPKKAILTGLIVYILIIILLGVLDPHTLYAGVIWKIVIIMTLVNGYKGSRSVKVDKSDDLDLLDSEFIDS